MKGFIKGCPYSYPDFYGRAAAMAKTYSKHHPEADEETVFWAAQEAAHHYELSDRLRCYKFKNIVHLYIRQALYKQKRKNKEEEMARVKVPTEEFFADYNSGMTTAELAEKYGMTKGAVRNKIRRAEAKEKEPETAATVTSSESATTENLNDNIIAEIPPKVNSKQAEEPAEEVKEAALPVEAEPVIDFIEFCTREVAVLGKRFKVLRCLATNENGVAEIRFRDENGFEYVLELRGIEEGT